MSDRIRDIFEGALDLSGDARREFLDSACAGNSSLREKVEALLAAAEGDDAFLSEPTAGAEGRDFAAVDAPAREVPGTLIGPYKVLQLIGEGGFGTVFMAEQEQPVQRRVALKIIKLGMDTRAVIARFEAERQALAMMDHPNIAKVLDAGATDTGRPYFVMELCKGDPIVQYCDTNNLSIHDRLELFAQVCAAVQHAHTKGIIHRDIKPSNILVSTQDGRPSAKVIDFGIVKATAGKLTEKTLFTEHRQLIGTPEYMSPEQAEGSLDIDTRTDVYSLGVLLYELLTGTTPFSSRELRWAAYAEIQRIIREVEPPKPSTRLSQNTDALASVAARRHTEPRRLGMTIRGDLDWIVMRALEKDRQRRYETANDLAADVRRHLAGEPVVAAPPSAAYRLKKFIRRNRLHVGAAAMVGLALLLGMAGTAWQARVAAMSAEDAKRAGREASEARDAEKARADELRQVADFQASMLKDIDVEAMGMGIKAALREQVRGALAREWVGEFPDRRQRTRDEIAAALAPFEAAEARVQGVDVARSVIDQFVLRRAGESLDRQFGGQPLLLAQLRDAIGTTYRALGMFDAAEPYFRSALDIRRRRLGPEHVQVAASLGNLASVLQDKGDYSAAEPLFREALAQRRRLLGEESAETATSLNDLAVVLYYRGEYDAAEPLYREAIAVNRRLLGGARPELPQSLSNLASLLHERGNLDAAEPLYREALALYRKLPGGTHTGAPVAMNQLASLFADKGDYAAAEALHREALDLRRKLFGEDHPDTAVGLNSLGQMLWEKGDYDQAEVLLRETLKRCRRLLGNEHPNVAASLNNLAAVLHDKGDDVGAEQLFRESLAINRRLLGDEHPEVANGLANLGVVLITGGNLAAAEPLLRESLALRRKVLGDENRGVAAGMDSLAMLLRQKRDYVEAEKLCRGAMAVFRRLSTGDDPDLAQSQHNLAMVLKDRGDIPAAEAVCREALEGRRRMFGAEHPDTLDSTINLGALLRARGANGDAIALLEPIKARARETFKGARASRVAILLTHLGGAHAELGRVAGDFRVSEAELLEAHTILRAMRWHDLADERCCVQNLVNLYSTWDSAEPGKGYGAKAAEWKVKLDAVQSALGTD